jgi:hypothetical protein
MTRIGLILFALTVMTIIHPLATTPALLAKSITRRSGTPRGVSHKARAGSASQGGA